MADNIDQSENLMWGGCYCCTTSLWLQTPDCIGCSGTSKFLCVNEKFCCQIPNDNNKLGVGFTTDDSDSDICLLSLFCMSVGLTSKLLEPICRQDSQQCCFVGQAAFPPEDKIPKLIGTCLLICWSEKGAKGFMQKYSEFK